MLLTRSKNFYSMRRAFETIELIDNDSNMIITLIKKIKVLLSVELDCNNLILSIVESEFITKQYKVSPSWIDRDVGLKWCNEGESVTGQHICLVCNCPCTINYLNEKGEVSDEVCQPSCTVIPKAHLYMEWSTTDTRID